MEKDLFRGTIYVRNDNELHAFQTAALICGYCVSIFPIENGEYRIEVFIAPEGR